MKVLAVVALAILGTSWATPTTKTFTTIEELPGYDGRIISGEPATLGQFPWQAVVRFTTPQGQHFCGGSLISDQWILTAAHCTADAQSFDIQLGTIESAPNTGLPVHTTTYIRHKGYNDYLNNDLALIKLPTAVEFNDNVKAIKLPKRGNRVGDDEKVTVSGFGKTSDSSTVVSPVLNFVELDTISNNECSGVYGPLVIVKSTVCAVGHPEHSTCNGDSGGPLVQFDSNGEATHVGIVSFVNNAGCASGNPSGYVRTESYLDWINENTGLNFG